MSDILLLRRQTYNSASVVAIVILVRPNGNIRLVAVLVTVEPCAGGDGAAGAKFFIKRLVGALLLFTPVRTSNQQSVVGGLLTRGNLVEVDVGNYRSKR